MTTLVNQLSGQENKNYNFMKIVCQNVTNIKIVFILIKNIILSQRDNSYLINVRWS